MKNQYSTFPHPRGNPCFMSSSMKNMLGYWSIRCVVMSAVSCMISAR